MKRVPSYVVSVPLVLGSSVLLYAAYAESRVTQAQRRLDEQIAACKQRGFLTTREELAPYLPTDADNAVIPLRKAITEVLPIFQSRDWSLSDSVPDEIWNPMIAAVREAVARPKAYEAPPISLSERTRFDLAFLTLQRRAVELSPRDPKAAWELILLGDRLARLLAKSLSTQVASAGLNGHDTMITTYFAANYVASPRPIGSFQTLTEPLVGRPSQELLTKVEPAIMCDLIDRASKDPDKAAKDSDPRLATFLRDKTLVLAAKNTALLQYAQLPSAGEPVDFFEVRSRRFGDDVWGNFIWTAIRPPFTCGEIATHDWGRKLNEDLEPWLLKAAHAGPAGPSGIDKARTRSGLPIRFSADRTGFRIAAVRSSVEEASIALRRLPNGFWILEDQG